MGAKKWWRQSREKWWRQSREMWMLGGVEKRRVHSQNYCTTVNVKIKNKKQMEE
jgi:hypothetical protein